MTNQSVIDAVMTRILIGSAEEQNSTLYEWSDVRQHYNISFGRGACAALTAGGWELLLILLMK